MKNDLKIIAKLNRRVALCNFWQRISTAALRVSVAAFEKSRKIAMKNIELVGQLVTEESSDDIKKLYDELQKAEL